MLNVVKLYLYAFPILLAFWYPNSMVNYRLELSLLTFFLSISIFLFKFRQNIMFRMALLSVVLLWLNFIFTNNSQQEIYYLLYIVSSFAYISTVIYFIKNYSLAEKYKYMKYIKYLILIFMLFPIYNYFSRPIYNGGNQMMYYIIGMYLVYLAMFISQRKQNKDYLFLISILLIDLFISKNRGAFPLVLSLIVFLRFYSTDGLFYKSSILKNKLGFISKPLNIVLILTIGLLPVAMYFGIGESLINVFVTRTETYSDGGINGRQWLFLEWIIYFENIFINGLNVLSPQELNPSQGPHNTFMYLLYHYSLFSVFIYIGLFYYLLRLVNNRLQNTWLKVSVFVILLAIAMLFNTASMFIIGGSDPIVWIGIIVFFYSLYFQSINNSSYEYSK